jgi:stearoyl-CoA desaturase (delta-9 desaturase)
MRPEAENDARKRRDGLTLNQIVAALVLIVPLNAVVLAVARVCAGYPPSRLDLAIGVGLYVWTMAGLTAGYHRLFSHRSFRAHPVVRAVLAVAGAMAVQGPLVRWVALHRRHHACADHAGDPHAAAPLGAGWRAWLLALANAHAGWMLRRERVHASRFAPDLRADRLVRCIDRLYALWILASLGLPAGIGAAASGTLDGAASALLWGGLVRIFCVHHASWAVNSCGHSVGARPFLTGDRSTNNGWLALLTLGEGFHNGHHAFPASARHGHGPREPDPTFWLIRALQRAGLVSDVKVPSANAVAERRRKRP